MPDNKIIKSMRIATKNIPQSISQYSLQNNIPISSVSFELVFFKTFLKTIENGVENIEDISVVDFKDLDHSIFLDKNVELYQEYIIDLSFKKEDTESQLYFKLAANKTLSTLMLTFSAGQTICNFDNFKNTLIALINQKKMKSGLLINIFDQDMYIAIENIYSLFEKNNSFTFEEETQFKISEAIPPIQPIHDKIVAHYKNKQKNKQQDHIDYSKRGFMYSVLVGEIVLEYIKPKNGYPGRNLKGLFVDVIEPTVKYSSAFLEHDSIEKIENDEKIIFKAKESGYVSLANNTLAVLNESTIKRLGFKETGTIETALNSDIVLNVTEAEYSVDAIGTGSKVKVHDLNSDGAIGSFVSIDAINVNIKGQVHKTAVIKCEKAYIKILKGTLYCKEAVVDILDGGIIYAETVKIGRSVGGRVLGSEISIDLLGSKGIFTATKKIEIKTMAGEDNILTIDSFALESKEKNSERNNSISILKKNINKITERILFLNTTLESNLVYVKELIKKASTYSSQRIPVPLTWAKKIQEFKDYRKELHSIKHSIVTDKLKLELLQGELNNLQNTIFDSYISVEKNSNYYNLVHFIFNKKTYRFVVKNNSQKSVIVFKKAHNNDYYISSIDS